MSAKNEKNEKTLREMLDEFEQIVEWFDGEDLDVDAAAKKFDEGSKLAEKIRAKLAAEKNKIEIVKAKFDAAPGNPADETEITASPEIAENEDEDA